MRSFQLLTSGLVIAGALLLPSRPAARPADPVVPSTWRQAPIAIDGAAGDWAKLEPLEKGPAIALENDGDSLYFVVATSDPEVRQQLATGLVVWLDPTGKKVQGSGLRIAGVTRRPLPGAQPEGAPPEAMGRGSSTRALDQFDWLGPGKNQRKLVDLSPTLGVGIASGTEEGVLAYEIQLPLKSSLEHPYAVEARPGSTICLGLETPNDPPAREGRARRGDSGGPSGGLGGGRGGRGGAMGGGMPPRGGGRGDFGGQPVKPMKLIWVSVKLAAN